MKVSEDTSLKNLYVLHRQEESDSFSLALFFCLTLELQKKDRTRKGMSHGERVSIRLSNDSS